MEEQNLNNFITISNYIGKIDNGIAVDLSMKIKDDIYKLIYWFDKNDNYKISAEDKLLKRYKITNIYEYKNYKKLAYYIHNFVIKDKEKLFIDFKID